MYLEREHRVELRAAAHEAVRLSDPDTFYRKVLEFVRAGVISPDDATLSWVARLFAGISAESEPAGSATEDAPSGGPRV